MAPLSPVTPYQQQPIAAVELATFDVIWPDGRPYALNLRSSSPAPFLRDMGPNRVVRTERRTFRVFDGGRKDETLPTFRPLGSK